LFFQHFLAKSTRAKIPSKRAKIPSKRAKKPEHPFSWFFQTMKSKKMSSDFVFFAFGNLLEMVMLCFNVVGLQS